MLLRALLLCQLVKIQTINKGIGFLSGLLYGVHKKDLGLLMSVKNYFHGVGFIGKLSEGNRRWNTD